MENRFGIFTGLLTNIKRCIQKLKNDYMEKMGLKSTHVSCLYNLYKSKHLTLTELCEVCDENKAAISRTVDYLVENKYVEKKYDETTKYKVPLTLTKKGEEIGQYIDKKVDEIVDLASVGINDKDREILYASLNSINKNLQMIANKGV